MDSWPRYLGIVFHSVSVLNFQVVRARAFLTLTWLYHAGQWSYDYALLKCGLLWTKERIGMDDNHAYKTHGGGEFPSHTHPLAPHVHTKLTDQIKSTSFLKRISLSRCVRNLWICDNHKVYNPISAGCVMTVKTRGFRCRLPKFL